jgi:DNA-binding transcriptional LysR family regulator
MELYQLRTFVAVAESRHLTRAAEKLHVSQPAVSAQLKALEDELELSLFERTSTGMLLTAAGQRLLPHAERTLAAAQDLRVEARVLRGHIAGTLKVGTLSDPDFIRVGELLARSLELHPLLKIELHSEVSGAAFEAVREGELDASFYFGELAHPGVADLALQPIVYRVAAPVAWRDRVNAADWGELASMPWILTPSISTHNRLVGTMFREHGLSPAKVVEADHEAVIKTLIVSGVGLSLLREDLARSLEAEGEVCIWARAELGTTLRFIYPADRAADPLLGALLDVIRDVWQLAAAAPAQQPVTSGRARRGARSPA